MARQTRQQRQARRAEGQPALAGGPPSRPPARPTANADGEPGRRPQQREARRVPGSGFVTFVKESYGELRKVEWPNQKAVISGTAVVMIACVIVGAYLWVNDELWRYFVRHVLLR